MSRSNRIKSKRVLVGMTQQEMAEKLGIAVSTYKKKEYGETEFTESEINKFLEITGSNYEEIFLQASWL